MTVKLAEQLKQIRQWVSEPGGKELWDVLVALRGPDSPSETPGMASSEHYRLYQARRKRKYHTVEVIRGAVAPNPGSGYRWHYDDKVTLPSNRDTWDHFDKHVEKAAGILGLSVVLSDNPGRESEL